MAAVVCVDDFNGLVAAAALVAVVVVVVAAFPMIRPSMITIHTDDPNIHDQGMTAIY